MTPRPLNKTRNREFPHFSGEESLWDDVMRILDNPKSKYKQYTEFARAAFRALAKRELRNIKQAKKR